MNIIHSQVRLRQPVGNATLPAAAHEELEVIPLLRTMQREKASVAVRYGSGTPRVLVAVITGVDTANGQLRLAVNAELGEAERAVQAGALTLHARHKNAAVQFAASGVRAARRGARTTLVVALSDHALSYDRRRYYRLCVPLAEPVRCMLSFAAEGKKVHVQMAVADISEAGIALICTPDLIDVTPGSVYGQCHIELPGNENLVTVLEVRNSFEYKDQHSDWVRIGCAFVDIGELERMRIRRYIERVEYQWRDWLPDLDFAQQM